ncbi:MAG: 2-phosphosulfolactate phosphatase [Proteobacteria bacterium]|nr:2-phosphosulfolactate phosphatase [Pseudomonadota bacterium]
MQIRLASLAEGASTASGTVVIIDVFRAFTAAAIAFSRGAQRIIMVDDLDQALALRAAGAGEYCIGERHGAKPPGFDFGNSPAELSHASLDGKILIQTTTNGTAGINAARRADRVYAGAFVTAEATVRALRLAAPPVITLVAMGREGTGRADEDELCALYLRSRLEGRTPDAAALFRLAATMVPPPNATLVAGGDYDLRDRELALQLDLVAFAIAVRREADLLIAEPYAV